MVPKGGLEPPRPKASDFESLMSTNSITSALTLTLTTFSLEFESHSLQAVLLIHFVY